MRLCVCVCVIVMHDHHKDKLTLYSMNTLMLSYVGKLVFVTIEFTLFCLFMSVCLCV